MANRHRGEIEAELDGKPRRLRLTLATLAELEDAFGASDLGDLAKRLAAGRLTARAAARIIAAGLTGAGEPTSPADAADLAAPGGAAGYADIVVRLLEATFPPAGAQEATDRPFAGPASPSGSG